MEAMDHLKKWSQSQAERVPFFPSRHDLGVEEDAGILQGLSLTSEDGLWIWLRSG